MLALLGVIGWERHCNFGFVVTAQTPFHFDYQLLGYATCHRPLKMLGATFHFCPTQSEMAVDGEVFWAVGNTSLQA
jgi:hypothetical protein